VLQIWKEEEDKQDFAHSKRLRVQLRPFVVFDFDLRGDRSRSAKYQMPMGPPGMQGPRRTRSNRANPIPRSSDKSKTRLCCTAGLPQVCSADYGPKVPVRACARSLKSIIFAVHRR
jgi:hypothetical protein